MRNDPQHGEDAVKVAESRAHPRLQVHSLAYIELSDENAGLILNISETGVAVQAVQVLTSNQFPRMRFRLPGTEIPIEAAGRLVWQIRSKKEAGIEFVGLPEAAQSQIRSWIAAEPSRVAAAAAKTQEKVDPFPGLESPSPSARAKPVSQPRVATGKSPERAPLAQDAPSRPEPVSPPFERASRPTGNGSAVGTRRPSTPRHGRGQPTSPGSQAASAESVPTPPTSPPAPERKWTEARSQSPSRESVPASPTSPPAPERKWSEAPPGYGWRSAMDRPGAGAESGADQPYPQRAPVMPQWNGYVAPGVGMEYRKPRRWWTYTAVLGLLAALGFAGLMMFNPDSINRARVEALVHEPGTSAANAQPSKPGQSTQPSSPSAGAPDGDTSALQVKPPSEAAPSPANPSPTSNGAASAENQPSSSAQSRTNRPNGVSSGNLKNSNRSPAPSQSYRPSNRDTYARNSPATSGSRANPYRPGAQTQNSSGYRPTPSNQAAGNTQSGMRQSQTAANAGASNTSPTRSALSDGNASSNNLDASQKYQAPAQSQGYQQQTQSAGSSNAPSQRSSSPALRDQSALDAFRDQTGAPPASSSRASTAPSSQSSSQQTLRQRDQDAYARPSNSAGSTATPSRVNSQPGTSSVEMPGATSPVPPSVPLSGVPSGSVGATSQFHTIRIPAELQSRRSQLAGNLQIGQLISSYSPAYPIGAAREGIEGTVKLDVLVGRDGTVRNVTVLSGPPMLASAAANAVRDWRYGETLLAGQPIETQQWVTIVFRLAK